MWPFRDSNAALGIGTIVVYSPLIVPVYGRIVGMAAFENQRVSATKRELHRYQKGKDYCVEHNDGTIHLIPSIDLRPVNDPNAVLEDLLKLRALNLNGRDAEMTIEFFEHAIRKQKG